MTKYMPFVYDTNGYYTNQKCFIITGSYTAFLTAFFNSSLFKFCFRDSFPELQGGTRELSKIFFDRIPVLMVSETINNKFADMLSKQDVNKFEEWAIRIDDAIFDIYNLSIQERYQIGHIKIQW